MQQKSPYTSVYLNPQWLFSTWEKAVVSPLCRGQHQISNGNT